MNTIGQVFRNCGQKTVLIDHALLEQMKQMTEYDGAEISSAMLDFADKMVAFAQKHEGFFCGLVKVKFGKDRVLWFALMFLDTGDELIRVAVQNARCPKCDWRGLAADPTVPYLFDTLDDRFELMRCAAKRKAVPCPQCGSKLDHHGMHAVWVWSDSKE